MESEWSLDAKHINFVKFVLSVFGQILSSVLALVADKCATNKSIATKMHIPLVGRHIHRLNLSASDIINTNADLVSIVRQIMQKLKHLIPAATFRLLTPFRAKMRQCYSMELLVLHSQAF